MPSSLPGRCLCVGSSPTILYPNIPTVVLICSMPTFAGSNSISTLDEDKSALADWTPGKFDIVFCTLRSHPAHDIPSIRYFSFISFCSVPRVVLHMLLCHPPAFFGAFTAGVRTLLAMLLLMFRAFFSASIAYFSACAA